MTPFVRIENMTCRCSLYAFVLLCALTGALLARTAAAAEADQRFVATDLWVKDAVTGLMWSRDANPASRLMSWDDAVEFVVMLNEQKFAGHSDWKLPDIDELKKLVAAVKEAGAVDSFHGDVTVASVLKRLGFHNVQAGDYWSSTQSLYNDTEAWYMNMKYGVKAAGNKSLYMCAWPVRWEE
jgi:hypothetical protein